MTQNRADFDSGDPGGTYEIPGEGGTDIDWGSVLQNTMMVLGTLGSGYGLFNNIWGSEPEVEEEFYPTYFSRQEPQTQQQPDWGPILARMLTMQSQGSNQAPPADMMGLSRGRMG